MKDCEFEMSIAYPSDVICTTHDCHPSHCQSFHDPGAKEVPKTRVVHIKDAPPGWKSNPDFIYIGRGSKWGNPYRIRDPHPDTGEAMSRDQVCDLYEERQLPRLRKWGELRYLRGRTLVCFCHPERCHGHSLAAAADEE